MKRGRHQGAPAGIIPAAVVDEVLSNLSSMSPDNLARRLDALAGSQPNLWAFITPLSNSLPSRVSLDSAVAAFAIIWMFENHYKQDLPRIDDTAIRHSIEENARSFFDFEDIEAAMMAGRNQPSLYRFIAETIADLRDDKLNGFDLYTLFVMLKTTADVLDDAASGLVQARFQSA
jgi:hypothetical protein